MSELLFSKVIINCQRLASLKSWILHCTLYTQWCGSHMQLDIGPPAFQRVTVNAERSLGMQLVVVWYVFCHQLRLSPNLALHVTIINSHSLHNICITLHPQQQIH